MIQSNNLTLSVYDWFDKLRVLNYWHVARLKALRVGEKMYVGYIDSDTCAQFKGKGQCWAYFEKVRGGFKYYAELEHTARKLKEHPHAHRAVQGEFKMVKDRHLDIACQQSERTFRLICRSLSLLDKAVKSNNEPDRPPFSCWIGKHVLKSGFTSQGIKAPNPLQQEQLSEIMDTDAAFKGIKLFKGREDCADVFNQINLLVYQLEIYRTIQVETLPRGAECFTFCNLWRIHRLADGSVRCFEFDLTEMEWQRTYNLKSWPELRFWPVASLKSDCESMYFKALDWIFWKVGLYHLPHSNDCNYSEKIQSLIYYRCFYRKNALFTRDMPYKLLGKVIFKQIIDRILFSTLLSSHWNALSLRTYLIYAMQRDDVLRVASEHKNLFPLLEFVPRKNWKQSDLFAQGKWLDDRSRCSKLIWSQVKPIYDRPEARKFYGFYSPAAYRWMRKAPLTVVRSWSKGDHEIRTACVIENIVQANITVKVPAIVWIFLINKSSTFVDYDIDVGIQRLYRAFVNQCAHIWQTKGFIELKAFMYGVPAEGRLGVDFRSLRDWLQTEGTNLGHPNKNATWDSLLRHSHDWHQRIALAQFDRKNTTWSSALNATVVDGCEVKPLISRLELHREGRHMHHCIASYEQQCIAGKYRVFSIQDAEGKRSTLGIERVNNRRSTGWRIDQHKGVQNADVNQSHSLVGQKIVKQYIKQFNIERSAKSKLI